MGNLTAADQKFPEPHRAYAADTSKTTKRPQVLEDHPHPPTSDPCKQAVVIVSCSRLVSCMERREDSLKSQAKTWGGIACSEKLPRKEEVFKN